MAQLFGKRYTRQELLTRVGDLSQIGGIKAVMLNDGSARGVRAAECQTGSGLNFTVLLDRGLDIAAADYCGQSLCWRSATGEVAPTFYEPDGLGWLRSFHGGLLTTCGLTHIGAPDIDQGKSLGLHDRISNIPASNVAIDGQWEDDDYVMWIRGKVRQTAVFQENLILHRSIRTRLGEPRIWIDDVVENAGYTPTEHLMLYHINAGFPVLDDGAFMLAPFLRTQPRDAEAEKERQEFFTFTGPQSGFKERVYYHEVAADTDGYVYCALINKAFRNGQGFGVYVIYIKDQLPVLVEWKMTGEGIYVAGMEPATNLANGRSLEREAGRLRYLQPGETRPYNLEIGVLTSQTEICKFEETIQSLLQSA